MIENVSIADHLGSLEIRAPALKCLIAQLEITEEFACVKRDNKWNEDKYMHAYIDVLTWENVGNQIISAIADSSYYKNNSPTTSMISIRSKLYCSKRNKTMKGILKTIALLLMLI